MTSKSLSSINAITFLALYCIYKKSKVATLVCVLLFAGSITGCYQQFYRTNTRQSADRDILQRLQASNKFFIVHFPDRNAGLRNVSVNQNTIEGDEILLPAEHTSELKPKTKGSNVVKRFDKDSVLMQVHLYTSTPSVSKGRISIPISDISRMDVYEFDRNATTLSHTISTVGVIVTSVAVITAAVFAIICNCPQVYVENNGNAQYNGGMYSGAIYSTLERKDYMPLPELNIINNQLKISVKNAPHEEQFINGIQLLKVNHNPGEKVLSDRHGKIFSYKEPQPAYSINTDNILSLQKKDGDHYAFNSSTSNNTADIIMKFKTNNTGGKAKLIVNAKNSAWSGLVFKEFSSLFGESAEAWKNKQEQADPAVLENWQKDQALPLMVYLKSGDKWQFIDYFPLTGNTASRDMILEFDIVKSNSDFIEIKIETVFRFWDLDYVALDLTKGSPTTTEYIDPEKAITGSGMDQKKSLLKNDKDYVELKGNDGVDLHFALSPASGNNASSYFLVSQGYYHNLTKHTGKARTMELLSIKSKGGFNNFSKRKYEFMNQELAKYEVKNPGKR